MFIDILYSEKLISQNIQTFANHGTTKKLFFLQENHDHQSPLLLDPDCSDTFLHPGKTTRTVYNSCCHLLMDLLTKTNSTVETQIPPPTTNHFQKTDEKNKTKVGNSIKNSTSDQDYGQLQVRTSRQIQLCYERIYAGSDVVKYGVLSIGLIIFIVNSIQIISLINKMRKYLSDVSSKHKITSLVFILNLSLTDAFLGFGAFCYGISRIEEQKLASDIFRIIICGTMSAVSVGTLIAITFQRIYAVKRPFKAQNQSPRTSIIIVIVMWIVSAILLISYYFVMHENDVEFDFALSMIPFLTFPTVIIFLVCYLYIWYELNNRADNLPSQNRNTKRMLRLAIAIVIAFAICWLPASIFGLYKRFRTPDDAEMESKLLRIQTYLFTLIVMNSLINPILYFHFIRKQIKKGLQSCFGTKTEDLQMFTINQMNEEQ